MYSYMVCRGYAIQYVIGLTKKTFCPLVTYRLVSYPDPTLSRGKGSGDHGTLSWLCGVSSIDSEQANEIAQRNEDTVVQLFVNQDC